MVAQSASMDIAACLQQGLSRPCCSKILNCSWPSLFHKPDAGTSSELVVVLYFAECNGCWRDSKRNKDGSAFVDNTVEDTSR